MNRNANSADVRHLTRATQKAGKSLAYMAHSSFRAVGTWGQGGIHLILNPHFCEITFLI